MIKLIWRTLTSLTRARRPVKSNQLLYHVRTVFSPLGAAQFQNFDLVVPWRFLRHVLNREDLLLILGPGAWYRFLVRARTILLIGFSSGNRRLRDQPQHHGRNCGKRFRETQRAAGHWWVLRWPPRAYSYLSFARACVCVEVTISPGGGQPQWTLTKKIPIPVTSAHPYNNYDTINTL